MHQSRFLPVLVVAAAAAVPAPAQAAPPHHLVEVRVTGPAQMRRLLDLDLDLAGCRTPLPSQRRVEVLATERDLATLRGAGLPFRVVQRDLEAHYAAAAARWPSLDAPNPPLGQGAMGGHWTLAQMESILDDLHVLAPAICSQRAPIGFSVEGRPLWMVKISDNVAVDENEPEVLYDSLHHAREPLSMEATVVFMEWLVTGYGTDPLATFLVDERELWFVPCVNPDGYEYNRQTNPGGGGLWRKNRRNNGDGTFGVDLNRNYATAWNAPNGGSSANTTSETYRGTAAFSEPESLAMDAFAQARQFVAVFTTHTYTDVLLRPWGWQVGDPPNVAVYDALGGWFVQENGVQHGPVSTLLYIASGSAVDHHHAAHGSLAWTAELGRSNEGGFWPSGPAIVDIATRHQPMFRKVALSAGPALEVESLTVTEAATANGNGVIEPGETGEIVVALRNAGIAAVGTASLALASNDPAVALGAAAANLGALAPFATATNQGAPLTFAVQPSATRLLVDVLVRVSGDGRTQELPVQVPLQPARLVLADDVERDRGFQRAAGGTATTGLWERAAPQQTTSGSQTLQPGFQNTPGGSLCWVTDARAGTSAGTWDVDNGHTDLWSPQLDLRHLATAEASFALWYGESTADDEVQIDLSRDGGANWERLWSRTTSTGAWLRIAADLGAPLTDRMRLRVRAQDQNPSLVECAVDDFEVRGLVPDGGITLLGSGRLGSTLQVAMHADPGAFCFALASPLLGPGTTFPGVGGQLLLLPSAAAALPGLLADAAGRAVAELALPPNPALSGATFHWQQATLSPAAVAFGGNTTAITLQ